MKLCSLHSTRPCPPPPLAPAQAPAMARLDTLVREVLLGGCGAWPGLLFRWVWAGHGGCPEWGRSGGVARAERFGGHRVSRRPPAPLTTHCSQGIVEELHTLFLNHHYSTGIVLQGLKVCVCVVVAAGGGRCQPSQLRRAVHHAHPTSAAPSLPCLQPPLSARRSTPRSATFSRSLPARWRLRRQRALSSCVPRWKPRRRRC